MHDKQKKHVVPACSRWISIPEAAQRISVSESMVRSMLLAQKLGWRPRRRCIEVDANTLRPPSLGPPTPLSGVVQVSLAGGAFWNDGTPVSFAPTDEESSHASTVEVACELARKRTRE